MLRRHAFRKLRPWLIPALLLVALGSPTIAAAAGHLFCPHNKRCQEKPPTWVIKRICPKPICDPCTLEHHGYYQTCWRPSSVPPDWSHCPVPPPAVHFGRGHDQPVHPAPSRAAMPLLVPEAPGRMLPELKPLPSPPSPEVSPPPGEAPLPAELPPIVAPPVRLLENQSEAREVLPPAR